MNRIFSYWIPLFLYMAFILMISIDPSPPELPDIRGIDKAFHFAAYLFLGFLWARALRGGGRTGDAAAGRRQVVAVSFAASFALGLALEIWQGYLPERSYDILDMASNGAGGLCGALLYERLRAAVMRLITRLEGKNEDTKQGGA